MPVASHWTSKSRSSAVTQWFFDRKKVQNAVAKAGKTFLGKAGGYTRKVARSSIKRMGAARPAPKHLTKKGKVSKAWENWIQERRTQPASQPGTPPNTHTGFLRDDIVYTYDPERKSAVIGPWRQPWLNRLHEFGGPHPMDVVRRKKTKGPTWLVRKGSRIGKNAERIKSVTARYPARPFMRPALDKAKSKLPEFWHNSIGKL